MTILAILCAILAVLGLAATLPVTVILLRYAYRAGAKDGYEECRKEYDNWWLGVEEVIERTRQREER